MTATTDSESAPHRMATPPDADDADARRGARPAQPEPFLRGVVWPGTARVPYPRVDPSDRMRLPGDTWLMAQVPAGVRLELVGDATRVEIAYRTTTDQTGYRGDGAGVTFAAWTRQGPIGSVPAQLGQGCATLPLAAGDEPTIVHVPEGMKPWVLAVRGSGGVVAPAPTRPRWIVYGDSVAEGWIASEPARAWPAVAGRARGLDHVNLGYAGAARGETASAEQVAALDADVLTVCHGTNCWTRTPHSVAQMRANTDALLAVLRQEHPDTPIVVASPVLRPDAETTPNRLGATLADLRRAMEQAVQARIDAGDRRLHLVPGGDLLTPDLLGDGIHPDDAGHRVMAEVIGAAVVDALDGGR